MTRSTLLNTTTTNYLDLIGNGKAYRVPPYQHDYSWTEEQWEDLWNDIVELRKTPDQPDAHHYMGALVVQAKSDREFLVIDGQQRLATISILSLAVIRALGKMAERGIDVDRNRERAREIRNRFVGEKDPASLIEHSRLRLNEADDPFYQDCLVQGDDHLSSRHGLSQSTGLLWACFEYCSRRIGDLQDVKDDGEALAKVLSETIARRLLFILITVHDEVDAYTVFETLNARGVELTTTDLLKNYLFAKVSAGDLEAMQRRWRSLADTVPTRRFPDFLRYHLLCEQPRVRKDRLFTLVRERAPTPSKAFRLLADLQPRAGIFAALGDVAHEYWIHRPAAKPFVRELILFGARQVTPLLFAAAERFSDDDFVRTLKLAGVITFRYAVVSARTPSPLEAAYHAAAKAVLAGGAASPRAVFDLLRPIHVDDDQFRQDFVRLALGPRGGLRKSMVKYILCRLEADARGEPGGLDHAADQGTVEHILPRNQSDGWTDSFPSDQWEAAVNRLGNLTLIESGLGRQIGSKPYEAKRKTYEESAYRLTRRIPAIAPESWTPEALDQRQQYLADRAVHVWRADFTDRV